MNEWIILVHARGEKLFCIFFHWNWKFSDKDHQAFLFGFLNPARLSDLNVRKCAWSRWRRRQMKINKSSQRHKHFVVFTKKSKDNWSFCRSFCELLLSDWLQTAHRVCDQRRESVISVRRWRCAACRPAAPSWSNHSHRLYKNYSMWYLELICCSTHWQSQSISYLSLSDSVSTHTSI